MVGNLTMCTNRPCDPPTIASNRFFQEKGEEEEREQELSLSSSLRKSFQSHLQSRYSSFKQSSTSMFFILTNPVYSNSMMTDMKFYAHNK